MAKAILNLSEYESICLRNLVKILLGFRYHSGRDGGKSSQLFLAGDRLAAALGHALEEREPPAPLVALLLRSKLKK